MPPTQECADRTTLGDCPYTKMLSALQKPVTTITTLCLTLTSKVFFICLHYEDVWVPVVFLFILYPFLNLVLPHAYILFIMPQVLTTIPKAAAAAAAILAG